MHPLVIRTEPFGREIGLNIADVPVVILRCDFRSRKDYPRHFRAVRNAALIRQGLKEEGFKVSISKLCQWFEMPRRTVYYKSVKAKPKIQARFAEPIKAMINEEPSFGYRTVAALLGFDKNTVQRIFQLRGWQVKKRPIGSRPRVQALERVIRTLKEQCVHRHRLESLQYASRVIADWIGFYNNQRPHLALGMKTPAETFRLAAKVEQEPLGHYNRSEKNIFECRCNRNTVNNVLLKVQSGY